MKLIDAFVIATIGMSLGAACRYNPEQPPAQPAPDAGAAGEAAELRSAPSSDSHVESRGAASIRSGDGAGVRLQSRGGDPIVRARVGARSVTRRCRTGDARGRSDPNYNLDIDDPRAKAAFDAIAKARELAKNSTGRRACVRRRTRRALLRRHEGRSRGAGTRLQQGDGRPVGARIPTISMPRRCTRRA